MVLYMLVRKCVSYNSGCKTKGEYTLATSLAGEKRVVCYSWSTFYPYCMRSTWSNRRLTGSMHTQRPRARRPKQQQRVISQRQLSQTRIRRYFSSQRASRKRAAIALILGVLVLGLGFYVGSIGLITGLAIAIISSLFLLATSPPSDEQFDQWLSHQAETMYSQALQAFDFYERDFANRMYCVHSFVLPGSKEAEAYASQTVQAKKGKDGKLRCSMNVYTYFFFTRTSLALFVGTINAWNNSLQQHTYRYRYQHIADISPPLEGFQDTVNLNGKQLRCRLKQCDLELINGKTILLTATLQAVYYDRQRKVTYFLLPETGFESTLREVRSLLFSEM